MAMPAVQDKRWTAPEVQAMQEADPHRRYQVVDGELLVSPGPRRLHQKCVVELVRILGDYLDSWSAAGDLLAGPGEVIPDEHTGMQPDVFVIPLVDGEPPEDWDTNGRLLLAIEVLSPSTARFDRVKKRPKYQEMGAFYWIVDTDARVVEEWLPSAAQPSVLAERVEWRPRGTEQPLVIDIPSFFRKVFRER
jgi:Uma2 family endonuclease